MESEIETTEESVSVVSVRKHKHSSHRKSSYSVTDPSSSGSTIIDEGGGHEKSKKKKSSSRRGSRRTKKKIKHGEEEISVTETENSSMPTTTPSNNGAFKLIRTRSNSTPLSEEGNTTTSKDSKKSNSRPSSSLALESSAEKDENGLDTATDGGGGQSVVWRKNPEAEMIRMMLMKQLEGSTTERTTIQVERKVEIASPPPSILIQKSQSNPVQANGEEERDIKKRQIKKSTSSLLNRLPRRQTLKKDFTITRDNEGAPLEMLENLENEFSKFSSGSDVLSDGEADCNYIFKFPLFFLPLFST